MIEALVLAAVGTAVPVPADSGWNCANPTAQQEMNYCSARAFEKADAVMNAQWKITAAAMNEIDKPMGGRAYEDGQPGYFDALLKAQRAWISYRDAQCTSEGFYARGGTLQPLLISTCKTRLTEERTRQLKSLTEQ